MKKALVLLMAVLACLNGSRAQDDVDYRYEIGAALGGSFYRGQLNHKFFGQPGVAGGVVGRWNINPYMAVKAMLDYASVKGSTTNVDDSYRSRQSRSIDRQTQLQAKQRHCGFQRNIRV